MAGFLEELASGVGSLVGVINGNVSSDAITDKSSQFLATDIAGAAGPPSPSGPAILSLMKNLKGENWYKIFPYQFSILNKADNVNYVYTLPIPPMVLNTKMIPASQATPTLGGVVEETSDVSFWSIQIGGTTGTAVSRNKQGIPVTTDPADLFAGTLAPGGSPSATNVDRTKAAGIFREKLSTTGLLNETLSGVNDQLVAAGNLADNIASVNSIGGVAGLVTDIAEFALPQLPYGGSAVEKNSNGFTEIHHLHHFFMMYNFAKNAEPSKYQMFFTNFKTGMKWQIILQDFVIQQNARDPLLHRYNISLKAWNIQSVDNVDREVNRFAEGGDLESVNTLINFDPAAGLNAVVGAIGGTGSTSFLSSI